MTTATHILDLIKTSSIYEGKDVNISVDGLIVLDHKIPPDEIIAAVTDLDEVKITDKGVIIPKSYF